MKEYLDFKKAKCKNCYKCLRECPVKAIEVINHQAKIIEERCILCGRCTNICPQNAKLVHSEKDRILSLLEDKNNKVIASVAPSFIANFHIEDFSVLKIALRKLGFFDAQETSIGASQVTKEYKKLLLTKNYKNFITSSCPSINRLIQLYYPKALEYLAPIDSPIIAHTKMIKNNFNNAKIIFIGPCIAKKREADESQIVEGVLTFEELSEIFQEKNIDLSKIADLNINNKEEKTTGKSKFFPISGGIIESFPDLVEGYDYYAIDGIERCKEVLENIENFSGMFFEMNTCEYGCINGPCSLDIKGGNIKATKKVKSYAKKNLTIENAFQSSSISFSSLHPKLENKGRPVSEREIKEVLARTGKTKKEDELNCGACGYNTCREKAWAVINGFADVEMCLPYMRERAESFSYEIIQNSPNGIIIADENLKIIEINNKAMQLYGIENNNIKNQYIIDYIDSNDFLQAYTEKINIHKEKVFIKKTNKYIELSISLLNEHNVIFGIMKDITSSVNYNENLSKVKIHTLETTDKVIQKQMRVAQEIASLLGETTAETKVALSKLKQTLLDKGE